MSTRFDTYMLRDGGLNVTFASFELAVRHADEIVQKYPHTKVPIYKLVAEMKAKPVETALTEFDPEL